jgi:hypothetical protein
VILYAKHIDFEFATDGIPLNKSMYSLPTDGSSPILRRSVIAVAEESDNIFLQHFAWVYLFGAFHI